MTYVMILTQLKYSMGWSQAGNFVINHVLLKTKAIKNISTY